MTECEEHGPLTWHEDGNAETGPQEPYLDCAQCRYEAEHPILTCDVCHKESQVVRTSTAFEDFDPTVVSHLECGHVLI